MFGKWISDVDGDDFPISFAFIDQSNRPEHFDLDDATPLGNLVTDLADVDGVIVALTSRALVDNVRVLPRLRDGSVVPNVAVVRETVGHEPQLAFLHILLDRIQCFFFANLLETFSSFNSQL